MMKHLFRKTQLETRLLGIFVLFALFFTLLHFPIGEMGAWILSMTGEVSVTDNNGDEEEITIDSKGKKVVKKKKIKKKKVNPFAGKPVTVKLPKTQTPIVLYSDEELFWACKTYADFPELRLHSGKKWDVEKTIIRMSTDGRKLYIIMRLYDKFPDKAITQYSKSTASNAWKDDSIEIFLMKNKKSKIYCQYVISVTGIGHVFYIKNGDTPRNHASAKMPDGFISPYFDSTPFKDRFELEVTVDLSNIGIENLKANDSFLLQIVRNYRGQSLKGSIALQLFPVFIYADSRFGIDNHDRRAFQPVKIVDADLYSTMDKSNQTFLKGINK